MWIVVTAQIDATTTRKMRMNFDNVVSYGPANSAPCMVMCLDGQSYPIKETPEAIDVALGVVVTPDKVKRRK